MSFLDSISDFWLLAGASILFIIIAYLIGYQVGFERGFNGEKR